MKGGSDYEFWIFGMVFAIFCLQFHNPFQQPVCDCKCNGAVGPDAAVDPSTTSNIINQLDHLKAQYNAKQQEMQQMQAQAQGQQPHMHAAPAPVPAQMHRPQQQAKPVPPSPNKPIQQQGKKDSAADVLMQKLNSMKQQQQQQRQQPSETAPKAPSAASMKPVAPSKSTAHISDVIKAINDRKATGQGGPAQPTESNKKFTPPTPQRMPSPSVAAPVMTRPSDESVRSREDLGALIASMHPYGLGILLGVGKGDFALHLLKAWKTSPGLYMVDPYIHIWKGYDDPSNVSDKEHQFIFEDLRNKLAPYQGKHVLVRDFSHSFASTYKAEPNSPPPAFVFIDANHAYESVKKDLEAWWPIIGKGGLMAGSTYMNNGSNIGVAKAVDEFAAKHKIEVMVTTDDQPPCWYMVKNQ